MKAAVDKVRIWKDKETGFKFCDAFYHKYIFPKHAHDYYVIGAITEGKQLFYHKKKEYLTPPNGMILFNPGDDHTGKSADKNGFRWRAVYINRLQVEQISDSLEIPLKKQSVLSRVRVDDYQLLGLFNQLHNSINSESSMLKRECVAIQFMTLLLDRYAYHKSEKYNVSPETWIINKAKEYVLANFLVKPNLNEIAEDLGIDRFRLIREFNRITGMSPYAFFECIRINESQKMLDKGLSIAEVAVSLGFTDQSHFTRRFKRLIGVTPGRYLR